MKQTSTEKLSLFDSKATVPLKSPNGTLKVPSFVGVVYATYLVLNTTQIHTHRELLSHGTGQVFAQRL